MLYNNGPLPTNPTLRHSRTRCLIEGLGRTSEVFMPVHGTGGRLSDFGSLALTVQPERNLILVLRVLLSPKRLCVLYNHALLCTNSALDIRTDVLYNISEPMPLPGPIATRHRRRTDLPASALPCAVSTRFPFQSQTECPANPPAVIAAVNPATTIA